MGRVTDLLQHKQEPGLTTAVTPHEPSAARPSRLRAVLDGACLLILLGLAAVVMLSFSPYIHRTPYTDSSVFLYIAQRMLQGEIPYRDLWDHKGPILYLLNVIGLVLGRGSVWGVWSLELACLLASVWLGYRTMRALAGPGLAGLVGVVWLLYFGEVVQRGNLTEEYGLIFQFATIALFLSLLRRGWTWSRLCLLGLCTIVPFFLRANLIALQAAAFLALALGTLAQRDWRRLGQLVAGYAASAAVVAGGIVSYFLAHHALGDFLRAAFVFNTVYTTLSGTLDNRLLFLQGGVGIMPALVVPAALTWLSLLWWRRGALPGQAPRALATLCLLALPLECIASSLSGRQFAHYYLSWIPITALLTCLGLARLAAARHRRVLLPAALLLWGMLGVPALHAPARHHLQLFAALCTGRYETYRPPETETERLVAYLRHQTAPADTLLVLGFGGDLAFLSRRRSATRYFYVAPLYVAGFVTPRMVETYLRDLRAHPPRVIIDQYTNHLPNLERHLEIDGAPWEGWHPNPALEEGLYRLGQAYVPVPGLGAPPCRVYVRPE